MTIVAEKFGVVITTTAGREENVERVLDSLENGALLPAFTVVVLDGDECGQPQQRDRMFTVRIPKHGPGREQPRNVGARALTQLNDPQMTHVWFLDSDCVVEDCTLDAYDIAAMAVGDRSIFIGPYEFMPEGMREPHPELRLDMRWAMFDEKHGQTLVADLGVALGNFGGNLVWPLKEFTRIGGFHPQLHHGRCEDGELGLRAASHRVPMTLVKDARAYHIAHPVDLDSILAKNQRDVPLLNQWHPWVAAKGLIVTDQDGARFDYLCQCGEQMNTLLMWEHQAICTGPQHDLILPDGL